MLKEPEKTAVNQVKAKPVAGPNSAIGLGGMIGNAISGLSGRLLILTVIFVMLAEILILVPSIANFRNTWLQSHLDTAETASIVYLDSSNVSLSEKAQDELLRATEAVSVSIREGGVSRMMASMSNQSPVVEMIDLSVMRPVASLTSSLSTLFFGGDRLYSVSGPMKSRKADIQLVQEDRYLRAALLKFARNILLISIVISLITSGLVFLSLYWLIVRPIIKLSSNMDEFSMHPENTALVFLPSGRRDEIGVAETRLSALQKDLQATLRQKKHLADLGLAVSKINHDLRNILASALLFSDRLAEVADPTVQRLAPKLVKTIDRAVEYTHAVLAYGKAMESAPKLEVCKLHGIIEDVAESLSIESNPQIQWVNKVDTGIEVKCDREQIFRAILNISRNALQAMEESGVEGKKAILQIDSEFANKVLQIRIKDNGPGIPDALIDKLFGAFQGSSKSGGTGLGLAIAIELVKGHGGDIQLEKTGQDGSVFLISLPTL